MFVIKTVIVLMAITTYIPRAGGINGGGVVTRSGVPPHEGMAACGWGYPFGTVFEIADKDMTQFDLPQVVVCTDRGGLVGNWNLDITLMGFSVEYDWVRARAWGKRTQRVRVFSSMDEYHRAQLMVNDIHGPR
jgi:hypothetical protein